MDAFIVTLIDMFIAYLYEQVQLHDIYVFGAQGQPVAEILPRIPEMENSSNTKKILERIRANIYDFPEFNMKKSRSFDCSGLGTEFFMKHNLISGDTTADGLYKLCDEIPLAASSLKLGDMVFQEGYKTVKVYDEKLKKEVTKKVPYQHHIGYVSKIEDGKCTKIVEAKGRAYGVVESDFKASNWTHGGRPKFWNKEPEIYTLNRELYLTDPMIKGEDVQKVQERLNVLSFNCGTADGVFGSKTEIAVKNFQHDAGLEITRYGTVGKKTAHALGFKTSY